MDKTTELAKELLISRVNNVRVTVHAGRPVFLPDGAQVPSDTSDAAIIAHNNRVLDIECGMCFALAGKFAEQAKSSAKQVKFLAEQDKNIPAKKKAARKSEEDPDFK